MPRRPPPLLVPLVLIMVFSHVALSGGRVAASLFALQDGASEALVGALIGVYGVLPMFASLAVGRFVDRAGPVHALQAGVVAVALGVALAAAMPCVPVLFATAALCGIGFNMVGLAAQHAVGHLRAGSPADRIADFGWFAVGHSTSTVCGPLLAGFLIDAHGYRAAFGAVTASACVAAILVVTHAARLSQLRAPARAPAGGAWELVAEPRLRRIYAVGVALAVAWDLFTFLMPILGHRRNLSASTIGTILSVFAAGTFAVRLLMSRIARRWTQWRILRTSLVVIVAVYVLLPLTDVVPFLFVLGFVLGAAVGVSQPNMLSLLHESAPPGRSAEAVGLRAVLGNASAVVVPLVFGATAASLGVIPVFWGVAVLLAAALPAAHRAARRDPGSLTESTE